MSTAEAKTMSYERLQKAVSENAAALRCIRRLQPAGGKGDKVFPPTYMGGKYAMEERVIEGKRVPCVLLDSVQSQANRMEMALLEATRAKKINVPLVEVDFAGTDTSEVGKITSLEAPHRLADAILRDSLLDGKRFPDSNVGKKWVGSTVLDATPLFELNPTALLFGIWFNPTGGPGNRGNLGTKFQRMLTSEIHGVDAKIGVTTGGQSNPLGIATFRKGQFKMYRNKATMEWSTEQKNGWEEVDPSELNLSGIPPDFTCPKEHKTRIPIEDEMERAHGKYRVKGGITMDHALQTVVLSLPALRRFKFPITTKDQAVVDLAARTVLAALGLCAATLSIEAGCDLRSRCLLVPEPGQCGWEVVKGDGNTETFALDASTACKLLNDAVVAAKKVGLPWMDTPLVLKPSAGLVALVKKSRDLAMQSGVEDGEQEG